MAIYAQPGQTFTAVGEDFATGLTGTIGVRIENGDGTNNVPRTTAGIVELEAGSGAYAKANLVAPTTAGTYVVIWDAAGVWASEELTVTSTLPGAGYTTVADLRGALAPGGTDTRGDTAASLTDAELTDAIAEAQTEVDAKLAARYTTPFPTGQVPPVVVTVTRDIAAYLATLTNRRSQPLVEDHPVRLRYARALAQLDALAAGDSNATDDANAADPIVVENSYDGSLFEPDDFDLGPAMPTGARWLG